MLEARIRIKNHLRKRGDACDFNITPTFIYYWWKRLNFALFYSKLSLPKKVIIRNFHNGDLGWCLNSTPITLGIREEIENRAKFLTVLTHEMVHLWELENYGEASHGDRFMSWKWKVGQVGLPLGEYIE